MSNVWSIIEQVFNIWKVMAINRWPITVSLLVLVVLTVIPNGVDLNRRDPNPGLLHHSDRGSQYAATVYQQHLRAAGMTGSMSRRGNCWDNACVERFFGTLKRELIHHRQYRTRVEAKQEIFDYLEVFYNRQRRHSILGYQSPAEFEARIAVE